MRDKSLKNTVIIIILCIIVNILGKLIAVNCNLPIWFDVVGTCVAAYFTGLIGAVVSGAAGSILFALITNGNGLYVSVNTVIGILLYFCAKKGYFKKIDTVIMSSSLVGILSVVITVPLHLYFNGGKTGNFWGDVFFDMLEWHGAGTVACSVGAHAIVDIIDKQISVVTGYALIKLILKYTGLKRRTFRSAAKTITVFVLAAGICVNSFVLSVRAAEGNGLLTDRNFDENYVETIYDSRSGLPYSEANAIAETEDGYIWIGGYAGLTRYNGKEFEFVNGITGVYALTTDSRGRLWISTNDDGVVVYDNGTYHTFTTRDGIPTNSVKAITEAPDGSMYVGTTGKLCRIWVEGDQIRDITVISDDVEYVTSMTMYGDTLAGITNAGDIFVMAEDKLLYRMEPRVENVYYTCVSAVDGHLLAGTSENYVEDVRVYRNMAVSARRIELEGLTDITDINMCSDGRVWICADTGVGYIKNDAKDGWNFYTKNFDDFDVSILSIHEDYEGNIWFVSQRCGVMKLSKSKFSNLFVLYGIDETVVNAVCEYNGDYYCGTDDGLVIVREGHYGKVENKISKFLDGVRIRSILKDSEGNLWFGTYSKNGLVVLDKKGNINCINNHRGTTDDRFRCMTELRNGTIAAGTPDGINYVDEGHVIGSVTQKDGLEGARILSLYEDEECNLYAATDGNGIYVIRDNKIVKHIGIEEGLTSDVVLRIVPYGNGFFVVAGNALCYMENDVVTHLDNFPYYDSFDIIIKGKSAYVLTSAGIYEVGADSLKANDELTYRLFNYNDGLTHSITSNAWNFMDESGRIFFCTNRGVDFFRPDEMTEESNDYKFGVLVTLNDGTVIHDKDGAFTLPADLKTFTVKASIRKYSLSDVMVKCFIDGINDEVKAVSSYDVEPIQISNLRHGTYPVHIQLLDNTGNVLQEKVYMLKKEAQVWENAWYRAYLAFVCIWMFVFIMWIGVTLANTFRRRRQLEMLRKELENKVNVQTEEIRDQAEKMEAFQWEVIESMASLIESRDGNTGNHVKNVSKYVSIIAEEMLHMHLYSNIVTPKYVDVITKVAPLHDVGKIKISDTILNKPGKFTPEEYAIMKNHAVYGGMIVEDILGKNADPQMIQIAKDVAYYHHEKWNGSGYPEGIAGDDIPLAARIMAVADVFDALVSKRVYKEAFDFEKAFQIIEEESGKHFDAGIVRVFLKKKKAIIEEIKSRADA